MELNRWQKFQFVVADKALLLSRYVEEIASRQLEMLEPFDPLGQTLKDRWRMGLEQFFMYSEMEFKDPKDGKVKPIEFSQRHMERAGICEREVWEVYKRVGVGLGVLVVIPSSGTYPAIRTHTRSGRAVGWSRGALREAFRAGVFEITPLPRPDSEPPYLNELRFTVAQSPRRGLIRTVNTPAPKAPQTVIIPEKQPVQGKITVPAAPPVWVEVGMPDWLRFESDRIERVLASRRFPVRVENAVVRDGIKAFSLHLHTMNLNRVESFMELNEEISLALGVERVSIRVYPAQRCAVISAVAQ